MNAAALCRLAAAAVLAGCGLALAVWGGPAPAGIADAVVEITSGPASSTGAANATFAWRIGARGVAVTRCRLDGAASEPCTSPTSYSSLAVGPHRFLIRAFDARDRQVGSDAWSWTVVARPVTTTTSTTTSAVTTTASTTTEPGKPGDGLPPLGHAIVGTGGADVLNGTPGRDVILGLGGDDTIRGRGGDDIVVGGGGDDALYGDAGDDMLDAGPGRDGVHGGAGSDRLAVVDGAVDQVADGGPGFDRVYADSSEGGSTAPPNVYSTAVEARYLVASRPIVFSVNGTLELMDANGGSVVPLLPKAKKRPGTGDGSPRWSPDGTQIAFVRGRVSGNVPASDLMVVNWDGTGLKPVTTTPTLCEQEPSWSPDGTRLAYYVEPCPGEERVAQKALDPAAPVTYVSGQNDFEDTEWRADGAYIYAGTCSGAGGGVYRIDPWTPSAVSGYQHPPGEPRTPTGDDSCAPEFSLSGGPPFRLLFQTWWFHPKKSNNQIYTKDDAAAATVWGNNLTYKKPPAYFWGDGPDWSADGKHIVFWHQGIWKMNPDGTGKQFLRAGDGADWR